MLLLDTNVISELRKVRSGKANPGVAQWAESQETRSLFMSAITLQELETGICLVERRDYAQGQLLRTWLDNHVMPAFAGRIVPVDARVALECAQMHVPDPRPYRDSLIAATALVHGMTVITRNVADFSIDGLKVFNPWS
jgi:predicted nucleic acid-binding protein|tara:strand:+ start:617 stop:1033 length:417 start_codon:yes stop_codon:yes gene_type:complete